MARKRGRRFIHPYRHVQGGRRPDLGNVYFRSKMEANAARYFEYLGLRWEHEPQQFDFPVKRGTVSFTPDFRVWEPGKDKEKDYKWVEVKGRLDQKSRTALKRFRKYYPEEFRRLHLMVQSYRSQAALFAVEELGLSPERLIPYAQLARQLKGLIETWE